MTSRQRRIIGAVAMGTAAAWALGSIGPASPPTSHRARAQPAPTPTVRPTPDRTATRFGDPLGCTPSLRAAALPDALPVGQRITVTAMADTACADFLDGAAVLVFVGSVEPAAQSGLSAALDVLGRALDRRPNTPLAIVDGAVTGGQVAWATNPAARQAAIDALAGQVLDRQLDGQRWADGLKAATAAVTAQPPSRRPILVIVDARNPPAFAALAATQIEASVTAVRDAVGHTILADLSTAGWLSAVGRRLGRLVLGFDAHVARDETAARQGMRDVVDGLDGLVTSALLQIGWQSPPLSIVPGSASPLPSNDGHAFVEWLALPPDGGRSISGTVVLEAAAAGAARLSIGFSAFRTGALVARADDVRELCLHPPGGSAAFCAPTPTPTLTPPISSTPGPSPTPSATVSAVPSRSPQPTSTGRPSPTPAVAGRVWLPVGYGRSDA